MTTKPITWNEHGIIVVPVFPPIPTRECDYEAHLQDIEPPTGHIFDAPERPYAQGWGATRGEAVADLIHWLMDNPEWDPTR